MNPIELLDYALGRLDGPRRERLERELEFNPTLVNRLNRVIDNLGRLLDDGQRRYPPAECPYPSPEAVEGIRPDDEDVGSANSC